MNYRNLSYRSKNKLLLIVTVGFFVLSYFLAFGKTIALYESNQDLRGQILLARNAPARINGLEAEAKSLESLFRDQNDNQDLQGEILKKITQGCQKHNVLFKNFMKSSENTRGKIDVETHEVILQGAFVNLIQLCNELEDETSMGKVVSVKFQLEQDMRNKEKNLLAYFYIQSIKMNNNGK